MDTPSSLSTSKSTDTGAMGLAFHGVRSVAEGDATEPLATGFSTSTDTSFELDSTDGVEGWTGAVHIGAGADFNSTPKE
jgi:hypothetical protein